MKDNVSPRDAGGDPHAPMRALVDIAKLPLQAADECDILHRATAICQHVLGPGVALTVTPAGLEIDGAAATPAEHTRTLATLLGDAVGSVLHEIDLKRDLQRTADQLREAMQNRAPIEQAKGVLMGQRRCTPDEAFDELVRLSSHENRKLRDIAVDIVRAVRP